MHTPSRPSRRRPPRYRFSAAPARPPARSDRPALACPRDSECTETRGGITATRPWLARSLPSQRRRRSGHPFATVPTVTSTARSRLLATTELCTPHNRRLLRDDRCLAGRASLNGLSAVWRRGFGESAEGWTTSGPITSENADRCVAAGSGASCACEGRGRRRASRARRFGVLRCLDVPLVRSTEPRQQRNTT